MINPANYTHKDSQAANRPIFREALWGIDYLSLKASAIYYGFGAKRGDGSPVVLIPGFMGTDYYMAELYFWLWRIGYKPQFSGIGWNANCLDKLGKKLVATIEKAHDKTGKPAHLIGHSLGGILARSAAVQRAGIVSSVIALGSPFRGIRSHPMVMKTAEQVRSRILRENNNERPECFTGGCDCETVRAWDTCFPSDILQTAVYTETDGIVDWEVCIDEEPANNYKVSGTHVGLVVNPQVYRIIADRLYKSRQTAV